MQSIKETLFSPPRAELARELKVGSLTTPEDVWKAVDIVCLGGVVAAQMRGVFGLWFNGADQGAIRTVTRIKYGEERLDRKFSAMMFSDQFVPMIDKDVIAEDLRLLFSDPRAVRDRFGAMCHIRAPIKPELVERIPYSIVSEKGDRHYLQNLDPSGHKPMSDFIQALNESGVEYVAVSSFNRDEKEITAVRRAKKLCRESGVSLLLRDPTPTRADILGSFAIMVIETTGEVFADRDGHIPVDVLQRLFTDTKLKKTPLMKSHGFPHADFSWVMEVDLVPEKVRVQVLEYVSGKLGSK